MLAMKRHHLTDSQWELFSPYLQRKRKSKAGRPQIVNDRVSFEGVLWILRTGAPWRALPSEFGHWQTVYKLFNMLAKSGSLDRILALLSENAEDDFIAIDSSIVKVHKHGSAPKGGQKKKV